MFAIENAESSHDHGGVLATTSSNGHAGLLQVHTALVAKHDNHA